MKISGYNYDLDFSQRVGVDHPTWNVSVGRNGPKIGSIVWVFARKKYGFFGDSASNLLDARQLRQVASFMDARMREWRSKNTKKAMAMTNAG